MKKRKKEGNHRISDLSPKTLVKYSPLHLHLVCVLTFSNLMMLLDVMKPI